MLYMRNGRMWEVGASLSTTSASAGEGKGKGNVHSQNRPRRPGGGVELYLYSFFNLDVRSGWVVNATPRPRTPWNDPVPLTQEAGWAPGPVWTGEENLAPTVFRSPDRPVRSQSLYWLR